MGRPLLAKVEMMSINCFVGLIQNELLKEVSIRSEDESEPVVVKDIPRLWKCLGKGNYAAVFMHKEYKDWVVKVYAREGEGIEKESEVYRRIGNHPSYSKLIYKGKFHSIETFKRNYLIRCCS